MIVSSQLQASNDRAYSTSNFLSDIVNRGFNILESQFGRSDAGYTVEPVTATPDKNTGLIAGISIGTIMLLAIAGLVIYFLFIRK